MEWSLRSNKLLAYHRLMRTDKPIGALLLLWPTLWALWVASPGVPPLWILAVFVAGVWLMRAAGCVVNDYADRKFDGHVKRTANRPLASGQVTGKEARLLFIVLVLLSFLLILARIDARTQLLPDRLTLPLLWAGLLFNLNEVYIALPDAVAGAMAGYLALWSVYWLFRLLTGKEALGYGDFKLLAALGAWCGWQVLPQVLLLASASGLVWTLLQRLWTRQSLQQPLAFGPWLALAGGGIFLWQQMV